MHNFEISSHKHTYTVEFFDELPSSDLLWQLGTHYVIDRNLLPILGEPKMPAVLIDATEYTKSYSGIEPIIESLLDLKLKRSSKLVAVGGGITQDITCFIANNFMRGVDWSFVPTTLLAQADSCIGSKSSINFKNFKNLLGSFTPPNRIIISQKFLNSLETKDIYSGIGEIIKLYLIDEKLVSSTAILENLAFHLYQTLQIKKRFIEQDEFDTGIRNILNYGHCLGHAIEGATDFAIPHGIAVSMGMDAANRFALAENLINQNRFLDMHQILVTNYQKFSAIEISMSKVLENLTHDKKNTDNKINLILPVASEFKKVGFASNSNFWTKLSDSLMKNTFNFQS